MSARGMYLEGCSAACTTCFAPAIDAAAERAIDAVITERAQREADRLAALWTRMMRPEPRRETR